MTNCTRCRYYIPMEEPYNYLNGERLCKQCFEEQKAMIKEFTKRYGEQEPKGYLTAKDLAEIKEFIEEHDPDITVEWKFEENKKEKKQ